MKVSLFVTCLVGQFFPEAGTSTVRLLRRYGCEVDYPSGQTCCGQPAFNSGYVDAARDAARNHYKAFTNADYIVSPSGSCTGMVHHYYAELFAKEPEMLEKINAMAAKTYEFSQFMINVLGVEDVGAEFPHRVTYHPACHGMRLLGIKEEPLRLLSAIKGIELIELPKGEDCCGFGGTFSVKLSDISGAMVTEKSDHVEETGAEYLVSTDMGCLMNINGNLRRRGSKVKILHLAELLYQASSK
jgi:L-lactate dehydrogenase complex protein LldE